MGRGKVVVLVLVDKAIIYFYWDPSTSTLADRDLRQSMDLWRIGRIWVSFDRSSQNFWSTQASLPPPVPNPPSESEKRLEFEFFNVALVAAQGSSRPSRNHCHNNPPYINATVGLSDM